METLAPVEKIIKEMISAIARKPEECVLNISEDSDDKGTYTLINIKVADEDIPVCIGTGGATAKALMKVAILAGRKAGHPQSIFVRVDAPRMPKNHFYEK